MTATLVNFVYEKVYSTNHNYSHHSYIRSDHGRGWFQFVSDYHNAVVATIARWHIICGHHLPYIDFALG